jgi:xylose isomerase
VIPIKNRFINKVTYLGTKTPQITTDTINYRYYKFPKVIFKKEMKIDADFNVNIYHFIINIVLI